MASCVTLEGAQAWHSVFEEISKDIKQQIAPALR